MAHLGFGIVILLVTFFGLRRSVGAAMLGRRGQGRLLSLALDAWIPATGFALVLAATARPILAGLAMAGPAVGLAVADRVKRTVLGEPVVFADRAELLEIVRHPRLYLPFAGTGRIVAGAIACVLAIAALVWSEAPLWPLHPLSGIALTSVAILGAWGCFVVPTWPAILRRLRLAYGRLAPSRDPLQDTARFGLLGSCILHATLARAERPGLQRAAQQAVLPACHAMAGPIVLVQAESFFDAGRLHPSLAATLPAFGALRREAVRQGRLDVPCWGANTIRSELAVLTGIAPGQLGLDRFNPYEAFARVELPSLVHQARMAGYHTICVHPFDSSFYGRTQVMPLLGFDRFVGPEAFVGARRSGPYVNDAAVAEVVAGLVRQHGPRVLVFAITMENHGPWDGVGDPLPPDPLPPEWRDLPEAAPLGRWLRRLRGTDAMIPILRDALRDTARGSGGPGWLALYGDHQPSLPAAFEALDVTDQRTDYLIWGTEAAQGPRTDLAAHELGATLLSVLAPRPAAPSRVRQPMVHQSLVQPLQPHRFQTAK